VERHPLDSAGDYLAIGLGCGRRGHNHDDRLCTCAWRAPGAVKRWKLPISLCHRVDEPTRRHGANEIAGAGGRWRQRPKIEYHATIVDPAGAKRINATKDTHQASGWRARTWARRRVLAHDVTDQRRSGQ
jgi:hypothetical protein